MAGNRNWNPIIEEAARHANGGGATLRQLHYLLVSNPDNEYKNTKDDYTSLSRLSAKARRAGTFPTLTDHTATVHVSSGDSSPIDTLRSAAESYRRDYKEGQPLQVRIVVEKNTLLGQVRHWASPFGLSHAALGGYGSQTAIDQINRSVRYGEGHPLLLYIGDHDPSGQDIQRDFIARTEGVWMDVVRLAVNPEQIDRYGLFPAPGKTGDPRARGFVEEHGELVQVEVEAIEPDTLRQLVEKAIIRHTDLSVLDEVKGRETVEKAQIMEFVESFGGGS